MSSTPSDHEPADLRVGHSRRREEASNAQSQHTGGYRSIRPRPLVGASESSLSAPMLQLPVSGHEEYRRRGRSREAIHMLAAESDPSPLLPANTARRSASGAGAPISSRSHISLFTAGSDPSPLQVADSPVLPGQRVALPGENRNTSGSTSHGQYFPFRHSRGRATYQPDSPLQPFLLGLPLEIRYRIYRILLIEAGGLNLTTNPRTRSFRIPALLHINQQVREEASHIWYGLNSFTINVRHGETLLVRSFLAAVACLRSPSVGRLEIILNSCFQCNDLVAVAALLIASNVAAYIKCIRGVYHVGHPKTQPCKFNVTKAITGQHFRPSVATALLQCSNSRLTGAGFITEESFAEDFASGSTSARISSVIGYAPTYSVNLWIRTHMENAMGSVGLLLH